MTKGILQEFLFRILLGLGALFVISPVALYWFIHGSQERYIWMINGPYPFDHLGGGPFQLFAYIGLLVFGTGLLVVGLVIRKKMK